MKNTTTINITTYSNEGSILHLNSGGQDSVNIEECIFDGNNIDNSG